MKLKEIRKAIDSVDSELLILIAKRFELCKRTRRLKNAVVDRTRESHIEARWLDAANVLQLNPEFVNDVLRTILTESKALQSKSDASYLIGRSHESNK